MFDSWPLLTIPLKTGSSSLCLTRILPAVATWFLHCAKLPVMGLGISTTLLIRFPVPLPPGCLELETIMHIFVSEEWLPFL